MAQHVIGDLEPISQLHTVVKVKEAVVRDHNQCVHDLAESIDPLFGELPSAHALEGKRERHHADRQRTGSLSPLANHPRSTGPCSPTHTRGDEHHVCTSDQCVNILNDTFGCAHPDFGVSTGPIPSRTRLAQMQPDRRLAPAKCLSVRIDRDEPNTGHPSLNHPIDCVATCPTDPDDADVSPKPRGHFKVDGHQRVSRRPPNSGR